MLIAYGLVVVAVGMDLKSMRISNRLILVGLGISLVRRLLCEGICGLFTGIVLISLPVILLYLLFLAGALGAGDIKLFSLIGGFVSLKELLWCIFYSFLIAAALSFLKMCYYRTFFSSVKNLLVYINQFCMGEYKVYEPLYEKKSKIHFSIAILLGLILSTLITV